MRELRPPNGSAKPPGKKPPVSKLARLPGVRPASMPSFFEPMQLRLVDRPPSGDEWLHEIKHDGYRMLAHISNGQASIWSRKGLDWTHRFKRIAKALDSLPVREAVLDGEIAALAESGATTFEGLQNSLEGTNSHPVVYFVFDIVHLDGYDLKGVPLLDRKKILRPLLTGKTKGLVCYTDHILGKGERFFAECAKYELEGVVSKRVDSTYLPGHMGQWLKSKCRKLQEFVVAGFTLPEHAEHGVGGLILGVYTEGGSLQFAGGVGVALKDRDRAALAKLLSPMVRKECPFGVCPADLNRVPLRWIAPKLVAQVAFTNWTRGGVIRHGIFKGLRDDKDAKEVRRET
jgi:bifunctional non-homologous end joining protein LigD